MNYILHWLETAVLLSTAILKFLVRLWTVPYGNSTSICSDATVFGRYRREGLQTMLSRGWIYGPYSVMIGGVINLGFFCNSLDVGLDDAIGCEDEALVTVYLE
ncbi:hypothetical protein Tco_1216677 [Tanacetum coccineum]